MRVPKYSSTFWMVGLLAGLLGGIIAIMTNPLIGGIVGTVTLFLLVVLAPPGFKRSPLNAPLALFGFAAAGSGTLLLDHQTLPEWIGITIIIAALCITWLLEELENR